MKKCKLCDQIREVNKIGVCGYCIEFNTPIERVVTYIHLPDTKDGRLGFKYRKSEKFCVTPSRGYSGPNSDKIIGRCHIYDREEWTDLIKAYSSEERKIYTHDEFKARHPKAYWLDDYSRYISRIFGEILQEDEGIMWVVCKELVRFKCKKGDFVPWDR
ncbi:hypothetical protein DFP93_104193 [Aneurinibacillus soli]|uniref:Uncharacterized protein n=1 Tax=Aneurinibacillus soli TaxID=1500254 RepID=A0A0U5ATM5_9BACL|nr:hypothetical protein [Aneurinibacillus soli]PYE62543.1 hypothetical protein DFP93_104193 [Aneurinibacillus soli]BAU27105.1 hypothetical protein CB4_01274 [Aneurinibacillus soli]